MVRAFVETLVENAMYCALANVPDSKASSAGCDAFARAKREPEGRKLP
jgi:hypothetical protein